MSAQEAATGFSVAHRAAILLCVILTVTLYFTTLMIASTILPQIQGGLSATADEVSWVMTFNLLATAVGTPTAGWLVARFGRRNVMVACMTLFAISTLGCALSNSLTVLVFWRIVQGACGAPTVPIAQSILLDAFPKHQHRMALGFFGMGVVIGPIIGPALGGYVAENSGWQTAFLLLVPVATAAALALRLFLPPDADRPPVRLDWVGFISLSVAVSCLQLVLARGPRLDWYDSSEIIIETFIGILAFYFFITHSLTAKQPFLNLRLLLNRNLAVGYILVGIFGMLNFSPMVLLPTLLRVYAGFPDSLVGEIIGARGLGGLIGFFLAMFIGRLDARVSMSIGFLMQVASGIWLMGMDYNVTPLGLSINGAIQGAAVGFVWIPLSIATFSDIPAKQLPEATGMFHLIRNITASLFISLCIAEIISSSGSNYARMTEFINEYNRAFYGGWSVESLNDMASIAKEIGKQSALIGYINAFGLYTFASAIAIPFCFLIAKPTPATAAKTA
ncbi:MAG: DHA2 family efflux MFS transporter permease subunit [Hyphomicrobiaceae bacterium]